MSSEPKAVTLPLDEDAVRDLRTGDSVLLSGPMVTARDAAHERVAAAIEAGEDLPFDPAGETLYFVGPTPARPGHVIGSAGPTTASRCDPWSPLLVERGLRGMVGKGRRSSEVKESMREHGCVYFGGIEGTAALLSRCITAVEIVAYEDLGTEAVRRLEVRDFPVLVVNDLHGGDLYDDGPAQWRRRTGSMRVAHDRPFDTVLAETIGLRGADDDLIEAYTARPLGPGPFGGVIVIHHMPGYDAATKEITRRFATMGHHAICPNLYSREAPGADPDDAAATARAQGGVPDARFAGDAAGAARWLRALPAANGAVAAIGFCSGGRQAVLAGIELDLQATIDCYGAFVVGTPPEGFPLQVAPFGDRIGELSAPLLGLFGNDDSYPSPDQVDELEGLLRQHDKPYEFHRYDGAGHAFLPVDRPSYRPEAAVDAWRRVAGFLDRHVAGTV